MQPAVSPICGTWPLGWPLEVSQGFKVHCCTHAVLSADLCGSNALLLRIIADSCNLLSTSSQAHLFVMSLKSFVVWMPQFLQFEIAYITTDILFTSKNNLKTWVMRQEPITFSSLNGLQGKIKQCLQNYLKDNPQNPDIFTAFKLKQNYPKNFSAVSQASSLQKAMLILNF